jgi:NTP pyrophosphatase (non-canonical NTP hydrolase)
LGAGINERRKLKASMPGLLNETGEIINWVQWNTLLKIVAMAYRINQLLQPG